MPFGNVYVPAPVPARASLPLFALRLASMISNRHECIGIRPVHSKTVVRFGIGSYKIESLCYEYS
jgi:hypothetical protein